MRSAEEAEGNFVPWFKHRREDQELRGVAGGGGDGGSTTLQARDAFFQDRDGGIVQPRVDVSEVMEVEQLRGVIDVVENVSRGLIDRRGARAGGWIG